MTDENLAKFKETFGQPPDSSSLENRRKVFGKLWELADNFRTAANFGIYRSENAVQSQNECFDKFHEARRLASEAGYENIPFTIQDFLEGKHLRCLVQNTDENVQTTVIQGNRHTRILAGISQFVGIFAVLTGIINLFRWFMSGYGSVMFIILGVVLYFLGMAGGTKVEVETTKGRP